MAVAKAVPQFVTNEPVTETANSVRDAIQHAAQAAQDADTLKKALVDMVRSEGAGWDTELAKGEAFTTYRIETTGFDAEGDEVVSVKDGNIVQVQFKVSSIRLTAEQVEELSLLMGDWFNSFFESSETVEGVSNADIVLEWINAKAELSTMTASAGGITVVAAKGEHIPGVLYGKAWSSKSGLLDIIREVPKDVWEETVKPHLLPLVQKAISSAVTSGDHAAFEGKKKGGK